MGLWEYRPARHRQLMRLVGSTAPASPRLAEPVSQAAPDPAPVAPPELAAAAFFRRLPPELGTDLISLSIEDHYLNVVTGRGQSMQLMSMADAERELAEYPGLRIHRSHWIARDHARAINLSERSVSLSDGRVLPVARSRLRDVEKVLARGAQSRR